MSRRSRRSETQPKYTPDDLEAEAPADDDVENEEDESEVTRCVCGRAELDSDASDPGFFIQCESCSVWQHGNCVGIADENAAPDIYWCEQCRPEMHSLFKDEEGITKSKYDPRTSSSRTRVDPRDQHYESMLKRALEESARESNSNEEKPEEAVKEEPVKQEVKKETTPPKPKPVTSPKEPKPRKKKAANGSKVSKPASNASSSTTTQASSSGFKANIPALKISQPEMTRRVFAIMEFLANIQSNLSAEDKFRDVLQELGNRNLDRSITGLKEDLIKMYNESVEGVDELMSLVNEWVETYDV